MISADNYTVTYSAGRKYVGTYRVTVRFKAITLGNRYKTFKITGKLINTATKTGKESNYIQERILQYLVLRCGDRKRNHPLSGDNKAFAKLYI